MAWLACEAGSFGALVGGVGILKVDWMCVPVCPVRSVCWTRAHETGRTLPKQAPRYVWHFGAALEIVSVSDNVIIRSGLADLRLDTCQYRARGVVVPV